MPDKHNGDGHDAPHITTEYGDLPEEMRRKLKAIDAFKEHYEWWNKLPYSRERYSKMRMALIVFGVAMGFRK